MFTMFAEPFCASFRQDMTARGLQLEAARHQLSRLVNLSLAAGAASCRQQYVKRAEESSSSSARRQEAAISASSVCIAAFQSCLRQEHWTPL